MERVAKTEHALLTQAFCAELAPPDPQDEPADALLQRILAERTRLQAGKKGRKKQ